MLQSGSESVSLSFQIIFDSDSDSDPDPRLIFDMLYRIHTLTVPPAGNWAGYSNFEFGLRAEPALDHMGISPRETVFPVAMDLSIAAITSSISQAPSMVHGFPFPVRIALMNA